MFNWENDMAVLNYLYIIYFSFQEWGSSCPHEFLGAYRLEADMSWTPAENIKRKDEELNIMNRVLNSQLALTDSFSKS